METANDELGDGLVALLDGPLWAEMALSMLTATGEDISQLNDDPEALLPDHAEGISRFLVGLLKRVEQRFMLMADEIQQPTVGGHPPGAEQLLSWTATSLHESIDSVGKAREAALEPARWADAGSFLEASAFYAAATIALIQVFDRAVGDGAGSASPTEDVSNGNEYDG